MSSVQYGKQIITFIGVKNFSNSGKVERYDDSRAKIITMSMTTRINVNKDVSRTL